MEMKTLIEKARKAMDQIKDYGQEDVDKLVYASAKAIYKNAEELAELAVKETGLGRVDHKIGKNTGTAAVFYDYLKDKKSVGIIDEIPEEGIIKVAHPVGVIAAISPATNPVPTPLGNFMHAVKGKNALVISPAPTALETTVLAVNYIREALKAEGAPEDLIQVIEEPSIENAHEIMELSDMVLATGGPGLTKAAYSSGKPAYGVGPGNSPVILDRDFDLTRAAEITLDARSADNGILCDSEEQLLYPEEVEAELFEELRKVGIVVFDKKEDVDKIREALFDGENVSRDLLGKDAPIITKAAGFDVPEETEVIALKVEKVGADDLLNKEIMAPVLRLKSYTTLENAVEIANTNLRNSGIGHTGGVFTDKEETVDYVGERMLVSRILVNQPTPDAWGPNTNGLTPAVSEGCGTWGNNILSANVDYIHLLNVISVAKPLDVEELNPDEVFAD